MMDNVVTNHLLKINSVKMNIKILYENLREYHAADENIE